MQVMIRRAVAESGESSRHSQHIGASAALMVSDIPFDGPIGALRVGRVDRQCIRHEPDPRADKESALDLDLVGTELAMLMVESEANQLTTKSCSAASMFGHDQMQAAIDAIHELVRDGGNRRGLAAGAEERSADRPRRRNRAKRELLRRLPVPQHAGAYRRS